MRLYSCQCSRLCLELERAGESSVGEGMIGCHGWNIDTLGGIDLFFRRLLFRSFLQIMRSSNIGGILPAQSGNVEADEWAKGGDKEGSLVLNYDRIVFQYGM